MRTKRRTKKVICSPKQRSRFLRFDYYRYIVTGMQSKIAGIYEYSCTDNAIHIHFENGFVKSYKVNEGEEQLKQVIKIINAYIGGTGDGAQ